MKTHSIENLLKMGNNPLDPDQIGPDTTPKKSFGQKLAAVPRNIIKSCSTRDGLLGDYDYVFLFKPNIPYLTKKSKRAAPFFGLDDKMPIVLALVLGFQHALSMLAGVITPPIIIAGQGGANFDQELAQYLVSTSLIVCGILSSVQITRFSLPLGYKLGTGLISVSLSRGSTSGRWWNRKLTLNL